MNKESIDLIKNRYHFLINNILVVIGELDSKGFITYVNPYIYHELGYYPEEIIGQLFFNLIFPNDIKKITKMLQKNTDTELYIPDIRIRNKNNQYVLFNIKAKKVKNNQNTEKTILTLRKNTDSKNLGQKSQIDDECCVVLENINDMIYIFNENLEFEYINESRHKKIMEYSKEDLIGKSTLSFIHPDDVGKAITTLNKAFKSGTGYEGKDVIRIKDKKGIYHWLEIKGRIITSQDQKLKALLIARDVTDRKELEEKMKSKNKVLDKELKDKMKSLKESERKFKSIFDNSFITLTLYDSNGKLIDANKACLELINISEVDDIKGYDMFSDPNLSMDAKEKLKNGRQVKFELFYDYDKVKETLKPGKSGKAYFSSTIKPIFDEKGNLRFYLNQAFDITERKEAEEKIRYQAMLVDNVSDAIISTDLDFNILSWNNAAKRIYGWKAEETIGKNIMDIITVKYPYDNQEDVLQEFFEKGYWNGEVTQPRKDGTWLNILSAVSLIKDEKGNSIGAVAINHDITKHKKVESELRNSREIYQSLIKNFHGIAFQGYQDFSAAFFHGYIEEITGYHEDDFVSGRIKWDQIVHPDDLHEMKEEIKKFTASSAETDKREYRIIKKNGKISHIIEYIQKFYDDLLKKEGVRGVFFDNTKFKEAEKLVIESEKKFRTLVEDAEEGVWALDENDNSTFVNPKICEMLGYSKEEMIGRNLHKFIPDSMKELIKENREKQTKGVKETYELQLIKKSGAIIYTEVKAAPIMDENGEYQGFFAYITDITNKKLAEQKIKDLMEGVPIGISMSTPEGIMLECNTKAYKIFGYASKQEFLKVPAKDFYDDPTDREKYINLLKKGSVNNLEIKFRKKDETLFWGAMTSIIHQSGGETVLINTFQDISDRKGAETKLLESEKKYRDLANSLPQVICETDIQGNLTFVNDNAYKVFGYTNDDFDIGVNVLQMIIPEDRKRAIENINYVLSRKTGDATIDNEYIALKKDGGTFPVIVYSNPIIYRDEPVGMRSIIIDITKQKSAERRLRESKQLLERVFDSLSEAIFILNSENPPKIINCNSAAIEIFEYSLEEMIGQTTQFLHVNEVELHKFQTHLYASIESNGYLKDFEFKMKRKSGIVFFSEHSVYPLVDDYRTRYGWVSVVNDITERKKAEEKLQESEKKYRNLVETSSMGLMEINVIERSPIYINPRLLEIVGYTQDEWIKNGMFFKAIFPDDRKIISKPEKDKYIEFRIINKEGKVKWLSGSPLYHYNKHGELEYLRLWLQDITEAKELEEIKSNLLTRISHELKTPLISIKGFTDLLLTEHKKNLNEQGISFLKRIKEGGNRLNSHINNFIETTQLDKHLVRLNKTYEKIASLIKKVVRDLEGLIELRKIEINMDIPNDLMSYVDKEKIHSVLSNLLSNALNFTPSQGKIFIKSIVKKKEIIISIKDNGIGLQKEEITNLFKPFGKIEKYGKGWDIISDGMGLGLYLSKEIINLHQGRIWVKSKGLNKGSTFYFSLPIV